MTTVVAYRAAARRTRLASVWHGKWHAEKADAEAQALRWKFEHPDPPDEVFIEALHQSGAVTHVATLVAFGHVAYRNGQEDR